jgi:hypothetical protein
LVACSCRAEELINFYYQTSAACTSVETLCMLLPVDFS